MDGYGCPINQPNGNHNLSKHDSPIIEPVGDASSTWQLSYDPNEIIGPEGYDSVRWVSINDVLNYTILFENDPEFATAAAQKVDVRFDFPSRSAQGDASLAKKAWMKGFGIGGYSFSNMSWTVAKPSNAYQQRIDLKDSLGYYVDLIAGLDVTRQQGFWTFTTIDPETGYAPWQAELGLLPVNDSTHVGEGAVTFQLKPYEGLHTGDTISIQAKIVFDQNDTIPTNRWCNKIDAGMPESSIVLAPPSAPEGKAPLSSPEGKAPLSSPEGDTIVLQSKSNEAPSGAVGGASAYQLTFTAADDEGGSGIKHLLLYLANHNGIYEEIDTVSVDTVLVFPVEPGKQYKLYSIAVDNTGNREPAKMEPDIILNFNQAPTDIALSNSTFQDDLEAGGFVGKLTSVDTEDEKTFTYALAEGDGAIHNDMFQINGDQLQIKQSFKCAANDSYEVRISTTDEGGMSYSKAFVLHLEKVLVKPKADTLKVDICEGETCRFHGMEYDQTGNYVFTKSNDFMCDSVYVLQLAVHKPLDMPMVTVEGTTTLVSSAAKGNQWFRADGTPIEGATEQSFTPTEDGIYYVAASNGACYSEPSMAYEVKVTDNFNLALDLKTGWNWVSSNLSEPAHQDAKQFLKPIESSTERFVGIDDELINDPVYGLTGGLTTIAPQEGYKLKVSEHVSHVWGGTGCRPETTSMNLHKGWNWIGYVPLGNHEVSTALAGLTPAENDVVKGQDDFSTYTGGKWLGTLTRMKPGEGYMYYATNATTFSYPAVRVFPVASEPNQSRVNARQASPWSYDAHGYPDNTTLIARLYINGAPIIDGTYTIGAFCNGECRGIGKNVDDVLFLTIHGTITNDRDISFKVWENATGNEYVVTETLRFEGQQAGNYQSPVALHVNETTGMVGMATTGYTIYPKPLRSTLYINGETEHIKTFKVLSADGTVNLVQDGYSEQGIDVSGLLPGVYVVAVIPENGAVYYEKVLKAQNK